MMADFMGNDISLGEVTRRLEALAQISVERKIDIDFLIFATVKGTGRRLGKSAGRLDGAREKYQSWLLIGATAFLKNLIPCPLRTAKHARNELAHLVICTALLRLWRRCLWVVAFLHIALQQHSRIDTKKEREQDNY